MKKIPSPAARITELAELAATLASAAREALPQDDALRQISELVERTQSLNSNLAQAERVVSSLKYELSKITDDLLPCAMQEVGMEEFTTTTGQTIQLQTVYGATIGKGRNESNEDHAKRREEAFRWLLRNRHDGIITNKLSVSMPRGETGLARSIYRLVLNQFGVELDLREDIHPSTLKSFVREQMQGDNEFPHALFRASSHVRANIKQEK